MIGTSLFVLLMVMGIGIPVSASLVLLGIVLTGMYSPLPIVKAIGEISWTVSNDFILVAVPLYVLMGEILMRSGISERMYAAIVQWVSWLPGGLMPANIGFCTMFAATSGSSVATAATIGTVAIPEIERRGYNERLFLGSIAAGGTLGILIPPSVNLILYGALTNTSIPQLYLAGFLPGFVLSGLFVLIIMVLCMFRPQWGGQKVETTWHQRVAVLPDLIPPLMIFFVVIGTIYIGFATPTESAALGVVCALGLAAVRKRLTWTTIIQSIEGCIRTTAMVMAILLAAYFLNFVIGIVGLTAQLSKFISQLGLTPYQTLFAVVVFYVILGCFMETLSMMVATVPIITPVMVSLGFDPVWFGIMIIILVETAMITPPVGINLYVVQGLRHRGNIKDVIIGAAPFVLALFALLFILSVYPDLALFLPRLLG
jgi:tripartite ATP-independent transporter DctM subunit